VSQFTHRGRFAWWWLTPAVFDLLALGPVPDDPDGPQAAIDEAVMGKVVRCVDAAGAVVDDLSEAGCHEAMALIGAASGARKLVSAHRRPLDHARPPSLLPIATCLLPIWLRHRAFAVGAVTSTDAASDAAFSPPATGAVNWLSGLAIIRGMALPPVQPIILILVTTSNARLGRAPAAIVAAAIVEARVAAPEGQSWKAALYKVRPAGSCYSRVRLPCALPSLAEAPQSRFRRELVRGAHESPVSRSLCRRRRAADSRQSEDPAGNVDSRR